MFRLKVGNLVYCICIENENELNGNKLDENRIGPLPLVNRL